MILTDEVWGVGRLIKITMAHAIRARGVLPAVPKVSNVINQ